MSNLIKPLHFFDNGSTKREKENFQGFYFNKVDMSNRNVPISFYRSDFRGTKFYEMTFSGNNFSNSDFIDSSIVCTNFDNCQFKYAEIYNSYFEKSNISRTLFSSASLVKLVFDNCNITDSKFDLNTFRECKFINCVIDDNTFEKSSMDDIEFEKTSFKNVDLSNMTAINLFFNDCKFENVIIDADYLGSYFFKGHFIDKLKLKYRGKIFDLNISQSDLLNSLFKIFMERGRYYEAINIVIQKNLLENTQSSIYQLLEICSAQLQKEKNQLKRSYQYDKIFKLLEYYINTGYISISDYFKILGYFENMNLSTFEFFEQISFTERINRLKNILDKIELSSDFIGSTDLTEKVLLEVIIEEKDQKEFEKYFDKVMIDIGHNLSIKDTTYQILGSRKGSLIYDILVYSCAALTFLKILKSIIKTTRETVHESLHLAIDYRLDKKALAIAKKVKGKDKLAQIKDIKEYQIIAKKPFDKFSEKESDEVRQLLPLLKSAVIYPNVLRQSNE